MSKYPSQYIITTCRIKERFAPTAFRASLSNAKQTVAFVQKREEQLKHLIQAGDEVEVSISPADFDRARILRIIKKYP